MELYYFKSNVPIIDCCNCPCKDYELGGCQIDDYCELNNKEKSCISELKPKQLEWEDGVDCIDETNKLKMSVYKCKQSSYLLNLNIYYYYEHEDFVIKGNFSWVINETLDKAKESCQYFYNKLFNKMIGE